MAAIGDVLTVLRGWTRCVEEWEAADEPVPITSRMLAELRSDLATAYLDMNHRLHVLKREAGDE